MKEIQVIRLSCFSLVVTGFLFSSNAITKLPTLSENLKPTSVTVPVDWDSGLALRSVLPSDIAYFIIDLKYSPERGVTYIEFGNGLKAGYKVLDHTIGKGVIYKALWEMLRSYQLPVWYIGSVPRSQEMSAWHDYIQHGGRHAANLVELATDFRFKNALILKPSQKATAMNDKKGIVAIRNLKRNSLRQKRFMDTYGDDFLVVNRAISQYVGDKRLTSLLFNDDYLKMFRPKSDVYPREYTPELADQIKSDLGCEWFVIKPVRSTQGNGVLMVHKDELDDVLKRILKRFHNNKPYDNNYIFARYSPLVMQYWKHDRNSHFLVEEYVESKPIKYDNKHYDATMRVIVFMHYDHGNVRIEFVNEYWKRPIKALEDEGTFREKHLSKHAPNYRQSLGGKVSEEDRKGVYQGLIESLPRIYVNMLTDYYITHEYVSQVQTPVDQKTNTRQSGREMKTKKGLYSAGRRKHILFNS